MAEMLYDTASTKASKEELIKFVKWCRERFNSEPAIVGGWAVYAYAKKEMSVDIDVVFSTKQKSEKIIKEFFRESAYKRENLHDQQEHFVKELKAGERKIELRFDYYNYEDSNKLAENRDIAIPWKLLGENHTYKRIENITIKVPCIELLLLYKVKAFRDRQTALDLRGIRIHPGQRIRIKSKLAKDSRDIKDLIATGEVNPKRLDKLLKQTNFKYLFNEIIKQLSIT